MNKVEQIKKHIKTHSERSNDDVLAVSTLQSFLKSDGKINTNFSSRDKWPNIDGTFEFVSNPTISRTPEQNFFVQIKGTCNPREDKGIIKYSLKSLAFPAFIYQEVTLDPCILFVVLNPSIRGSERVFWKYMSVKMINSIDYSKDSATIAFTADEEIKNTDESLDAFCEKLTQIIDHHSFVKMLENRDYRKIDIERIIEKCDEDISESIDRLDIYNETRDNVSKKILNRLYDLCVATLLLNASHSESQQINIRYAWEYSLLNIETKYLGAFLKGLKYIGIRIPDEGQAERLLLKYYDFLWQIRRYLKNTFGFIVLKNLEKFPHNNDVLDEEYYKLVAKAIDMAPLKSKKLRSTRYYVMKKLTFYVSGERYYEITLQLAGIYSTKYNRITVYTKENISTNYSIQIDYEKRNIDLWNIDLKIKVITSWRVSIDPKCLNDMAKVLQKKFKINFKHGEYNSLMDFLTKTGINILDLIDFRQVEFDNIINGIYSKTNTSVFKEVLIILRNTCSKESKNIGRNVIRYLLSHLKEEDFEKVLPNQYNKCLNSKFYLSSKCYPFDKRPFLSNLVGSDTSNNNSLIRILNVAGKDEFDRIRPYILIKSFIKRTGEIYFPENLIANSDDIDAFNNQLDAWECKQGYQIKKTNGLVYIDSYEQSTIDILQKLLNLSNARNAGQDVVNKKYIEENKHLFEDPIKEKAIKSVFVNSNLLMIYGAAGTGKSTLINYISNLMSNQKKLFLTKTHTALQNLKRRIDNPGVSSDFVSIDSFTKKVDLLDYDIIFVDECSIIDNRTMRAFLNKISANTFLVLAGDIYQIESIDFGNWFFYAKDIIKNHDANVELLSTWRTKEQSLISLWNEVRKKEELIIEKLVIDGPFSENIGPTIFDKEYDDEVVLCLNYDGKFGLNNMNTYFQNRNQNGEIVSWQEWTYKKGDYILFNDTKRFTILYNNLKGRIVNIQKYEEKIIFTIDVYTLLTERDCQRNDIEYISNINEIATRISFTVYEYNFVVSDEDNQSAKMKSVVPFQLAYAVSIHKAQGLEYDSVKIIIPSNNSERITHNIFYTAITRAKKSLKIYWSSESMRQIVDSFSKDELVSRSLEIIKSKLR